jgi:DNA-binding NarL/FixJ family response regulator
MTPRQHEILALIELGKENKDIDDALDLSYRTVEKHVHNMLTQFGASSREEIAAVARAERG